MGFANVFFENMENKEGMAKLVSLDVEEARRANAPFIHWVMKDENVKVKIVWSDAKELNGFGERGIIEEDKGSIIQMERIGYAKI